jgi:NDP-sugar pyrophosphorylase family protein
MKEKISISLDEQVLQALDGMVDQRTIRNRSQAIEFALSRYLETNAPIKAVLLGGGVTDPKKGPAKVAKVLQQLKDAGISEVVVAGGGATEKIFSAIADDPFFSKKSVFLREDKPRGTAGAVKLASNYLQGTFVVTYLDVAFEIDLKKMLQEHAKNRSAVTMALTYVPKGDLTDYVRVKGNSVTEFEYKTSRTTPLQNAAVYVFSQSVLDDLPSTGSLEKDVFPQLAKEGKLAGFVFDTEWKHAE